MDALLSRRLRIAIDDRIEAEYREVLARPRLGLETIRREPVEAILQLQVHVAALPWSDPTPPDELVCHDGPGLLLYSLTMRDGDGGEFHGG